MKPFLIVLLLNMCSLMGMAQSKPADTLQFNKRASRLKDQWVITPKGPNGKYSYGFIYVDITAGYTFHLTGLFTINAAGTFVTDTAAARKLKTASFKTRLGTSTKPLAIIRKSHYTELGITGNPDWLKSYNVGDTTTLQYQVTMGRHLNTAGDPELALTYLLKAYKVNQHAPGLEFELAYAYNVLRRFDDAINVLNTAIKNNDKDVLLIKELGFAYLEKKDIDKAIQVYKDGIISCGDTHLAEKAEMGINIGSGYRYLKNDDLAKEWFIKAKGWAPVNSLEYKRLVQMGY